ncbi:MAG: YncE family protein [Alphaproteobacteria bacterium]|nr:YncE family protein [Alphaproteobacteria bacterium]
MEAPVPATIEGQAPAAAPAPADAPPVNVYAETGSGKIAAVAANWPVRVYVPNHTSGTITVIDPATKKIVDSFRVGIGPQHVVPSFDLKTLWVNNTADGTTKGTVTPLDPATGKPGTAIPVDDPYNMYSMPDGSAAIIVVEAHRRLDLRDSQTLALKSSIPTPSCEGINHADFTADMKFMVLTCEFGGVQSGLHGQVAKTKNAGPSLIRVDLAAGKVVDELTFSKPGMPQDVRLSADGKTFFVTDMINDGVFLVDAESFKETGFIHTGKGAHGLNVSRDGKYLYVANRGSNRMPDRAGGAGSVSVINFETRAVEHTWMIPGGGSPDMGNVSADGKELWLSGRFDGQVYVIDTTSGAVTKINVGIEPHGLTLWPQPGRFSLGHTGNMR